MHRAELESWTNENGNLVLIGDSCHPMLPYLAQGANSSIEDGGVLGRLLGSVESKLQLPQAIELYEQLRKVRSEAIARETFHQRNAFHMLDGQQQKERNEIFASQLGKEVTCKFPSRWTCAEAQPWLYGCDAYKEADATLEARPFTLRQKSGQPVIRAATTSWLRSVLPRLRNWAYSLFLWSWSMGVRLMRRPD